MSKKYIITIVIAIAMLNSLFAQEQLSLRDKAQKYLNEYNYFSAAKLYQKLVDVKSPKLKDMENLAECYSKMQDNEAAETWYARIVAIAGNDPVNLVKYGETLKTNFKYVEAKKAFESYGNITGKLDSVRLDILGCDSAMVWIANPTSHKVKNEIGINTAMANFGAFPYAGGVYFISEPTKDRGNNIYGRTGRTFLSIYNAVKSDDNTLSNAILDSSVYNKGEYHIGPIISNKAGTVLYVTRTTENKNVEVQREGGFKYNTSNLELFIYTKSNGKWIEAPFKYNNVKKYSLGHAALSADERILYFISNKEGGFGGTDIWYCELQTDGNWGEPVNAGATVNTAKAEMFPAISSNGTLYFSSNGRIGMGGLDMFSAKGEKQSWSTPQNLKYPLNSPADDFALITLIDTENATTGFLSSSRKGGAGNDDIYSFTYNYLAPKIILALKGTVVNKKTGEIISAANVTLYDAAGQKLVARQSSTDSGTFFFDIDPDMNYKVLGQKIGFYSDSTVVSTIGLKKSQTLTTLLKLDPLFEVGKTIAIQNIHYDFDKDNIRADAAKILDELVRTMRDNPTLEIELGSHTDSRGVDIYNIDLSQRRAKSVVNYLVSRGIDRSRMTAKGYGETQLLNKCSDGVKCTPAEHQANRRTEFKILRY